MFSVHILLLTFLNKPDLIFCTQLKGFKQALSFNTSYSIQHLIRLNTVKWFQVLLCITFNSIKHQTFVYTQLNDQTVLFLTIQFNISQLFAPILNVKQFYLTH